MWGHSNILFIFDVGTQQGKENSRMYNEMAILKLVQSMTKLITSPPELFRTQIIDHFKSRGKAFYLRIKQWMEYSQEIISPVTGLYFLCHFPGKSFKLLIEISSCPLYRQTTTKRKYY